MSHIHWEGLLEMWQKKLVTNEKWLNFVQLPTKESVKVMNLYTPEHCGAENTGNNMISNEDLEKLVRDKRKAKAILLYSCVNITQEGILSSLKILNGLTLLVLDEVKISHDMMMVIAENVKTLKVISLFSYVGDVNDDSIDAVARENKEIEWFVLPGFAHTRSEAWKITSKAVANVVRNCTGLRKISMPAAFFDEQAVKSMIEFLQPDKFELVTARRWGAKRQINLDVLKQLFDTFPKLRGEDLKPELLRRADVPQGFEDIEFGRDEKMTILDVLNGKHAHMLKKLSIPSNQDEVLKALINKGLHSQIKEMEFGVGFNDAFPKATLSLLSKFTGLESLDLSFHLGEEEDAVKTKEIVKLVSNMKQLKKLDLSWSAVSPEGVKKIVNAHPLLVDLKLEGCGGEGYDYTEFLMGLEDVACLNRSGLKWSSRNKYGERSGMYEQQARCELEEMGMDTTVDVEDEDGSGDEDDDYGYGDSDDE